MIGKHFY